MPVHNLTASNYHNALTNAGLQIVGVSLGSTNDKTTWQIDWQSTPSQTDLDKAKEITDAFDPSSIIIQRTDVQQLADLLVTKNIIDQSELPDVLK